jgi:hypothetical protein
MKKIHYLFAFIAVAAVLSACHPLDETYKKLGPLPVPTAPTPAPITANITLAPSDYALLPSADYAKTSFSYKSKDDAAASIPDILAAKYPTASDKSSVNVIYANAPASITVADTLFTDVAYTLVDADYNSSFKDLSASQVLTWLGTKYPTPLPNQLALLTFTYYESGVTSTQTQSFLYLNGAWKKIYTISPAQYSSIGKGGTFNDFSAGDAANLPNYFNTFLKADPAVMATAKFGDVQYVSFKYFASKNYQRVIPLTFDGNNWVVTPLNVQTPLTFVKTNGTWIADNTVYLTLGSAEYKFIGTTSAGSQTARDNVAQYGDFNISSTTDATYWSDDDINNAMIALLAHNYPAAAVNQKFVLTYEVYNKGAISNVTKTFQYNGTTFVKVN